MLIIDSTKTITAVLSGAPATTNPDFFASYGDDTSAVLSENSNQGAMNGTTPVTIVTSPTIGTKRIIKDIYFYNKDTAPVVIELLSGAVTILKTSIPIGGNLSIGATGATVTDSSGATNTTTTASGNAAITGGTIDSTVIGGTTPAAATVTTLTVTNETIVDKGVQRKLTTLGAATGGITLDFSLTADHEITLTGNVTSVTITPPVVAAGYVKRCTLKINTGAGSFTMAGWDADIRWAGGTAPTITTTANKVDYVTMEVNNAGQILATISQNF